MASRVAPSRCSATWSRAGAGRNSPPRRGGSCARCPTWVGQVLLDLLGRSMSRYLVAQARASTDVLMLFDSWVGLLAPPTYRSFVLPVLMDLVEAVRARVDRPIVYFANGATSPLPAIREIDADVIGVDRTIPLSAAVRALGVDTVVQGNLDPRRALRLPCRAECRRGRRIARGRGRRGARLESRPRPPPPHRSRPGGVPPRPRARTVHQHLGAPERLRAPCRMPVHARMWEGAATALPGRCRRPPGPGARGAQSHRPPRRGGGGRGQRARASAPVAGGRPPG